MIGWRGKKRSQGTDKHTAFYDVTKGKDKKETGEKTAFHDRV